MRTILVALALALGSLVPANADPLPNSFPGRWCLSGSDGPAQYFLSYDDSCSDGYVGLEIKRTGYEFQSVEDHQSSTVNTCKFTSIKHTGEKTAPFTKARKEDLVPVIRIVASCTASNTDAEWMERRELFYQKGSLESKLLAKRYK
jgi:hypothetical protein